jgi:glycosyltransferase involved in cell wall biosynthesis
LRSIQTARTAFVEAGWTAELIVCDNNSTDRTSAIAREAGAAVVFEAVNQIGRARNKGAAAATGDWLIFVDADSHPSRELFQDVAAAIRQGDVLAGGSTVKLDGVYPLAAMLTRGWNVLSRLKKWAPGSFIFCEREAFRGLGGFSQELYASEEIDLFVRLNRLARRTGKRVVILHRHPLVTSGRKVRLYTLREHVRFLTKVVMKPSTLRNRAQCHTWYDGRR